MPARFPLCHQQVQQPGYQAFLRYACPGFDAHADGEPLTVPPGDDLAVCPRPVLGVYDDHDYGAHSAPLGPCQGQGFIPVRARGRMAS